jgi:isoleucyl-tRNA synthetase
MKRTTEVIDCWFDSGSMPFAQYHYPFENKEIFEQNFPADFISEAVDQTRGWFYTLLAISTLLFDKAPFKNCIVLGHVNDKNGIKMSKHKGNVVDPWTVLDKQGADAVRWYFYTSSSPWLPSRFAEETVSEVQRKYMGTLWNTYAFFVLYADIDKYNPSDYDLKKCNLSLMDKWILSKLNTLIDFVDKSLEVYNITDSSRALQDFTDILSNWYVRRCRERYWGSEMTEDKAAAYTTLYTVLVILSKLTAPYTPFIAESIYQNLVPEFYKNEPESVHLCQFPQADLNAIDKNLEQGMDRILDIVVLGRAARNASNIKNRQPLSKMFISSGDEIALSDELKNVALDELNIKEFEEVNDAAKFISYKLKPQLKTLGPKYGAKLGKIRAFLDNCNAEEVVKTVKSGNNYIIPDEDIELSIDDLLISTESAEGFVSASDKGITVALDTNITEKLLLEGFVREIVSKIQNMRKDAGFEVTDRITVNFIATGRSKQVMQTSDSIKADVLADYITEGKAEGFTKEWDIGGENVIITINKAKKD